VPPDPTPTPAPTFDLAGWTATVDASLASGLDLTRLLIFALVLMVGIVAVATVGLLVAQVRAS